MKILIDTNVLIDVLSNRKDFVEDSKQVFRFCEIGLYDGYVSSLSIADIVYILRKQLDVEKIESTIFLLSRIFHIVDLTEEILASAAIMHNPDYEDAIQIETAKTIGVNYIISNNLKDFTNSDIPCITPKELFKL